MNISYLPVGRSIVGKTVPEVLKIRPGRNRDARFEMKFSNEL